ncbi:hypothetical protein CQW23_12578 [Capsicum baccatum]|uniref:IPO4/5-like TPR repeats domain-containing protein n=1 Tax=Capsicum baccatum TaxID=33114 RepID=A0A2G2WT73_CAPBA|nr:hypothetical protein CQW23_12578 [Capsicum baccatum]
MASSSSPKMEAHRLAMSDFLPKRKAEILRPLIVKDRPEKKERVLPRKSYDALRKKAVLLLDTPNHDGILQLMTNLDSSRFRRVNKKLYNFCKTNYPNVWCLKLSNLLLHFPISASPEIKSKCADLLHFLLENPSTSTSFWRKTSHIVREELKTAILEILKQDNPREVCKLMWKTASQIFRCILVEKQGEWQGMLNFFLESLNSGPLYVQDRAILFFLDLPTCLGEELSQCAEELHLKLLNRLNSSKGMRKVLGLSALVNLVQHMSSDYYTQFHHLLMPMIEGVSGFLENEIEEENAQSCLKKLGRLAKAEPRFFDSHLDQVFGAMVTICENDKLVEETRCLAVLMMYAFDDISIKSVGEMILRRLSSVLVRMISLIPDGSSDYLWGETFMYRLQRVRGEDMAYLLDTETLKDMSSSSEWRKRYAAAKIISVIAKGCAKAMSDNLAEVVNVILKSMLDSSDVRLAAIRAVKAMSLALSPHTLGQHADLLITSLYLALADDDKPEKQSAAASAISSLCESCNSCIVEPRLQRIVRKLLQLIQNPSPEIQAESLISLASVARLSKDLFHTKYDLVITSVKKLLVYGTSKSVKDNVVECIRTVAVVVGKDIFKKDAREVMALLMSVRWYLGEDDYSSKVTLLRAWKHLIRCLRSRFYSYVKDLIPILLRSARLGSNSAIEGVILDEKFRACKLLLRLTRQFKRKFFVWIDQVSKVLVPLLTFHDKGIRRIAFSAMPELLSSAKRYIKKRAHGPTNSYLHKLVLRIVPSLLEALDKETDGKSCKKLLKSLARCTEIAGGFLSKKKIERTTNAIQQVLKTTSEKRFSEEETVTQLEKEIIRKVVSYFGILIKRYKESSYTFVDRFLDSIKAMVEGNVPEKEKQVGLFTFNEVSLNCAEAANRFNLNYG